MSGYSTPGFFEKKIERETAARVAAFLGGLGRGSENLGATGVRSDWMEQDGPALAWRTIKYRCRKYTDTIAVS